MLNMRAVDLNLLPFFEAAYEERSLSKAASRLSVTQPAVSHALARLRALFKDELFVRHSRGVTPTPVADAIYVRARPALALVREAVTETRGFDAASSQRRFHVAIPHPLGPMIAVRLLESLRRSAPGVRVAFNTRSRPTGLEQALRDGSVDAAIDWMPVAGQHFRDETLFRDRIVVAARNGHPVLRRRGAAAVLRDHGFVQLLPRVQGDRHREAIWGPAHAGRRVELEVSEILEVFMVAAASDLLGLIPESMAKMARDTLGLKVVAGLPGSGRAPVRLLWHEGRERDPAHRFLRAALREATKQVVRD